MVSLIDLSGPTLFDAVGVAGFGLYVLNYSMLTLQRVKSESIRYFAVNVAAASMVLVGLMSAFNLAAAMIQIFFICSSCAAILIRLRARRQAKLQLQY
jgi:predicted membrane protein